MDSIRPASASTGGPSPRALRNFKIIAASVVVALLAVVVWAVSVGTRPAPPRVEPRFDRFESAWSSAMAKAGVEATFPIGPVELTRLTPSGRRAFDATFTADEVAALLSVYPYIRELSGEEVSVDSVGLTLRPHGEFSLEAAIVTGGTRYQAVARGSAAYEAGRIVSQGLSALTVEGFNIGGTRRQQASAALVDYFNAYLAAAPGLTVESAEVVDGAVAVDGFAPVSLRNP